MSQVPSVLQESSQPGAQALRVLLVDDEPLARTRLRLLLSELDAGPLACWIMGEAGDAQTALLGLAEAEIDLILLDIRMPGLSGVEFVRQLRQRAKSPEVIFVSAYADHALDAFEVEAADYLPKPVSRARLEAALWRVVRRRVAATGVSAAALAPVATHATAALSAQPVLTVTHRGSLKRIAVEEVLYLKSEWKYITVRTAGERHLLDDSLQVLGQRLGSGFLRVHRNALVAIAAIDALERREIDGMETWSVRVRLVDEWIDVSRRQVAAVRKVLAREAV